jgi:hypothetical protein
MNISIINSLKFPKVRFAFNSNYIQKISKMRKLKEHPMVDTILVVDNFEQWHKNNFALNKKHYPFFARFVSVKIVNFFQSKGAKIHFNSYYDTDKKLIRYGIVDYKDFLSDLNTWSNLTVSSYMQKPFDVVVEQAEDKQENEQAQKKNLKSAVKI